jgi:cell division protein ZapA (FtsZ GTPase activity inhibitor)
MSQQLDADAPPPPVVVTIFDQPYRLRSGRGDEHLRRVAGLVDERMREVATHMKSLDMTRIAVLAALNLADELESLRLDQSRDDSTHNDATHDAATRDEAAGASSTANADLHAGGAQANEPVADNARRSWFEDIFEADDEPPTREGERRLSNDLSSKLRPRRRD